MTDNKLKSAIVELCSLMSVSGFEYRAADAIKALYGELFDGIRSDKIGNHLLVRRCGRPKAAKILIDAHMDEIGMLVSEVLEGGFLRIVGIGGIDSAIIQASDVVVYGKQELRGVVCSMPPHLRSDKKDELPEVKDMLIDIGEGYSYEELCELIPIGTPVGFAPCYSEFGDRYIAGKSFDDKACAAIAAMAIAEAKREELAGDVYLSFSAKEEVAGNGGVYNLCFEEEPDYAMVIDVNLGSSPDAPTRETVEMRKGISICYSAATDRALTRATEELCKEKEIAHTLCAAPSSTGTNATAVNLVKEGIPVVDIGLPIRNMHTYNEVLCIEDAQTLYKAVCEFIKSQTVNERFRKENVK